MTLNELGAILKDMYDSAPERDQVTMIHLFGIKYAQVIDENNFTRKEIALAAGIQESYHSEISKGIRLAKYVVAKS